VGVLNGTRLAGTIFFNDKSKAGIPTIDWPLPDIKQFLGIAQRCNISRVVSTLSASDSEFGPFCRGHKILWMPLSYLDSLRIEDTAIEHDLFLKDRNLHHRMLLHNQPDQPNQGLGGSEKMVYEEFDKNLSGIIYEYLGSMFWGSSQRQCQCIRFPLDAKDDLVWLQIYPCSCALCEEESEDETTFSSKNI
jgi:hypothetical protein